MSSNTGSPHSVDELEAMFAEMEDRAHKAEAENERLKNQKVKMRIEKQAVDGRYLVTFPEIPCVATDGETLEEALEEAEDCLTVVLLSMPEISKCHFDRAKKAEKERDDLRAAVELVRDACIEHASMAEFKNDIGKHCAYAACASGLQIILDGKDEKSCATCSSWNGEECESDDKCKDFDCWEA